MTTTDYSRTRSTCALYRSFMFVMADANKRKKSAYYSKCAKKSRTQFSLQPGLRGFLATCNFREKDCVREAINVLSEFADKIYGEDKIVPEQTQPSNKKIVFKDSDSESDSKDSEDIEAALAKEVTALKEERQAHPSKRRFQVVESGADNCVFIRTTIEDPVSLVEAILKDIETQAKQKTRFLLRLLPIEISCKAWPDDIKAASVKLLDKYFVGEAKSFCVVFKRRNNGNVVREELIQEIANDIKSRNPLHRADMKQPELVVIVEVIRNICCLAVVPKYFHYRKYNLIEVAKINQKQANTSCVVAQDAESPQLAESVSSVKSEPQSVDSVETERDNNDGPIKEAEVECGSSDDKCSVGDQNTVRGEFATAL